MRQGDNSRQGWHDVGDHIDLGAQVDISREAESHELLAVR
jgi:hypothetical protein